MIETPAAKQKFNKDLVIAADDGKVYMIPVEVYTDEKYRIDEKKDEPEYASVRTLMESGVICAAIPEPKGEAVAVQPLAAVAAPAAAEATTDGVAIVLHCYLINVAALRWQNPFDEK